jgi:hypothetical protein
MPDITMCANESCSHRLICYRAQVEPGIDTMQARGYFSPDGDTDICEYFIPMGGA